MALSADVINAPQGESPETVGRVLAEEGFNVIVLRPDANSEAAAFGMRLAGASSLLVSLGFLLWGIRDWQRRHL